MSEKVLNLDGFRCTNFSPDRRALMMGRFDVDNPCSWCLNRKHKGRPSKAYHYVEYGRWEFPFVAEENGRNRSPAPPWAWDSLEIKAAVAKIGSSFQDMVRRHY